LDWVASDGWADVLERLPRFEFVDAHHYRLRYELAMMRRRERT
jgi:hypothetical protein